LHSLTLTLHLREPDINRGVDALATTARSRLAAPRQLLRLRSDGALAERFAEGDDAAFAILFERHRASVVAVCIGVLGSRHDAEDASQETFAALAVALRSSPPRELRAWLTRVARNAAIDLARRRRTRESVNDELSEVGGPDGVSASQIVKDELESVIAGIRELPESQRTALLMRELAGHSYREIADLIETDEEAVRGLIARARVGLRQYREAAELPCATARAAIAAEPDGRRHDRTIRRHVRGCASCRAYRSALRDDARALRGLLPVQAGGAAGGSAFVGLAAKGALLGTAATQVTAACAVSVCAVGGIALIAPALTTHHHHGASAVVHRSNIRRASHPSRPAATPTAHPPVAAGSPRARGSGASLTITTGSPGRGRAGSVRVSTTGGSRSVTAPGRFTVPANGNRHGSTQRSGGQGRSTSGGSQPTSGRPANGGSPASVGSPSGSPGGSGPDSSPRSGRQSSGSTPGGSPPLGGAGSGDRGRSMFSGRMDDRGGSGPSGGTPGGNDGGGPNTGRQASGDQQSHKPLGSGSGSGSGSP
jgi:RNA polymerase sigma factor (sigma-70 family)